jgi:phage baseplate assembly protein W
VHEALERWEPRIDVVELDVEPSEQDAGKLDVNITYRVRATSRLHNLVYPFYVIPAEEFA